MRLPCMQHKCAEMFKPEHIQSFCSKDVMQKFNTIREDVRVGKNRKLKWCPKPDCGKSVQNPGIFTNKATCVCGTVMCFKCAGLWHTGKC